MLFNSWIFIGFFSLVLVMYYMLDTKRQNILLLVSSYIFYSFWDWRFSGLLLLSTIIDFVCAKQMNSSKTPAIRKRWLLVSLFFNLSVLGFFKYANFFVESVQSGFDALGFALDTPTLMIILPVGISFYTFQTMAYTIDVYRGKQEAIEDPIVYGVYVAYFPQLVAGPIERAQRLIPQISRPRKVCQNNIHAASQLILMGYLKKVAIADSIAPHVDTIFSNPTAHSSFTLWLGMYAFALQIYCDFSGYSDIARGISRLLGIELMENFKQPYLSPNITIFWRRWHISLSTWLRDYLYIPLGGNQKGVKRLYLNLMITMLLGGLWHGAGWNFIIWGGLHGAYLAGHRMLNRNSRHIETVRPHDTKTVFGYALGTLATFHLVCFTWIPFRADSFRSLSDYVSTFFNGITTSPALTLTELPSVLLFYGVFILIIDSLCNLKNRELPFQKSTPIWLRTVGYSMALFTLCFVREAGNESFIYFQF